MSLLFYSSLIAISSSCCAEHTFECTVSRHNEGMMYKIQDDTRDSDVSPDKCDYLWKNASKHTIAHNFERLPPVTGHGINFLTTSLCLERVVLEQDCVSKTTGDMVSFTAECNTACAENLSQNRTTFGSEDKKDNGWMLRTIVLCTSGAIFLAVCVLCYKFRDKMSSNIRGCQCGGLYTTVKTASDAAPVPPVDPPV